jgi:N-acetylmuramoyl-L-alanine amidase
MLTQIQHPRISYISRVLALPLLAFVFAAFSIKTRQSLPNSPLGITPLMHPVTVVIDAGHGGADGGAISPDGIKEKDINLSIVKKVAELNNNKNIRIVLTRQRDILQPLKEKVTFALQQKPDAFISLHINAAPPRTGPKSGFEILLSRHTTAYSRQSQLLGSILATEIEKTYGTAPVLTQRKERGVWVLDAPEISYPSLLLSCGYLTSKSDLAFITSEANQEKIARDILTAVERFAKAKEQEITVLPAESEPVFPDASAPEAKSSSIAHPHPVTPSPAKKQGNTDTLPSNIKSVDITRNNEVIVIYKNNTAEKITRAEAIKRGIAPVDKIGIDFKSGNMRAMDSVLFFVDGVEINRSEQAKINPGEIDSISVIKDKHATEKYGERGKYGVIEISLKKSPAAAGDKIIFQKVEKAPEFPGGKAAWTKYISGAINRVIDSLQEENKSGTCVVQFIVDTKGNLSEVKPLTMEGTLLSGTVVDALKNGPKWIPAMQNGHVVKAYHQQPVTFQIAEEK